MDRLAVRHQFEPDVFKVAIEPELEIISVEPSASHNDKEKERKT